ncbi:ABC transporter permease [Paenibacillus aquistagni]|uniref:ABC-2 type transport system permease protein n=1 Tax=Paenibacillus aquistagni TaxID=1852522 RepID=A0A1X7LNF3_9BACL|nr:ABC-2 family transporter protein [Paenibacillus aquistagni]SMG55398.1 ABC-2 type transport system permease protein [Paenibacillus aquistagni]
MKTPLYYLRIYLSIVTQYIKAKLQYRTDFFISTIGMIFTNIAGIFPVWIIFHNIPSLHGLSFNEMLFIYCFSLLALSPLQLFFDNIWSIWSHLLSGTFIKYYLKPMNVMFYYMSEVFDLKGLSQVAIGIGGLIYASNQLDVQWTLLNIVLLIVSLIGASLIMISLMILAASTGFWIMDPWNVISLVNRFRDFAKYPVSIFNDFFKFIFTFIIPIGCIAFYPSQLFLNPLQDNEMIVFFSPLIGIVLFIIANAVWNKGINSYSGTGS